MHNWILIKIFGFTFLSLILNVSQASANIGKVLLAVGEVNAKRQAMVKLSRGDQLLEKDIVITGQKGRAQLIMIDGAKIAVKPSSEVYLEKYQYKETDNAVVGSSESSMTMSLIKGGFRTISGKIGAGKDKSGYKVKTPVATIGIRGTDYSALICNASCVSLNGTDNVENGIYIGVSDGSIIIRNAKGVLVLKKNQFGYVASENEPPRRIIAPPRNLMSDSSNPALNDTNENRDGGDGDIGLISGLGFLPANNNQLVQFPDGNSSQNVVITIDGKNESGNNIRVDNKPFDFSNAQSVAYSGGFQLAQGFSLVTRSPLESFSQNNNGLTQFYAISPDGGTGADFQVGQAQLQNVGFDPVSGISWGRWSGGSFNITNDSGVSQSVPLNNSSFHWALDNFQTQQALPVSGSATYQLLGNTAPTNNLGDVGVLGSASFFVDFTNQLVANELSLGINQKVWSASGVGSIANGTHWFAGLYDTVLVDGVATGGGNFSGFLGSTLDSVSGFPAGAGLVYNLFDNAASPSEIVNGTLIFGQPKP